MSVHPAQPIVHVVLAAIRGMGGAVGVLCLVAQLCLTLCGPVDCSPPGSSVYGDSPGKNTGVGYMPSSRGSSQTRDQTQVSHIAGGFFTI